MLTSSTSFQGVLPVKTYRGGLCQTFEHDPKIWKAKKFVANFYGFLFVNEPSSMSAMENFESTISSNRQATTPAFSIFKMYSINFYIIKMETKPWEARVARR